MVYYILKKLGSTQLVNFGVKSRKRRTARFLIFDQMLEISTTLGRVL